MKKFSKVLYDVELYDFEKENKGWSTDYLYQVRLTFNDDTDEIIDFFDFWFKREKYGKFGLFDCVVEINTTYYIKGKEEPYFIEYND